MRYLSVLSYSIIAAFLFSTQPCSAQPKKPNPPVASPAEKASPVVKGLSKELPVYIEYVNTTVVHNMDDKGLARAKTALTSTGKFTEAEFTAMTERANMRNFPPGLNTVWKIGRSPIIVTGYVQARFLLPFNGIAEFINFVWVPMADNPRFPSEYSDGKDLFFFSSANKYLTPPPLVKMSSTFVAAMKAKHSKAQPEPIGEDYLNGDEGRALFQPLLDAGYTEAQAGRIMELVTDAYRPSGFSYTQRKVLKEDIKKLKSYRILEYNIGFGQARVYWVPAEENRSAPDSLRPLTDDGALITTMVSRQPADNALYTRKYRNKPEWEIRANRYAFYLSGSKDPALEKIAKEKDDKAYPEDPNSKSRISSSSSSHREASSSGSSGSSSSSSSTTRTTSSGISYSTADMSAFKNQRLGCMVFLYPNSAFLYVVPIMGEAMTNKAKVAGDAYEKSGLSEKDYQYQWFANTDAQSIKNQYGKSKSVRILNTYTIQ